jgi:hypothetical protein
MFNGDCISSRVWQRSNRMKTAKFHGIKGRQPVRSRATAGNFSAAALAEFAHAVQKTTSAYAQKI